METSRRWSGYVCPDCRFVFRVPRDHDGKGIVCPSCRRMLRIPTAADTPPPLMATPQRQIGEIEREAAPEPGTVRKRRKSRRGEDGEAHSWEQQSRSRSRSGEKRQMTLMLAGGAGLFAVILGAVFYSMAAGEKKQPAASALAKGPARVADVPVKQADVAAPAVPTRGNAELLAEAESLTGKFLKAKTIEEMLPLVREPENAEKRMRDFYQKDGVQAPGLSRFNSDGGFSVKGKLVSVNVVTSDFEKRGIAFAETPGGLKIDWESWVGWSEMPWEEFLSKKPTEGLVFRVTLSPVEYYNFGFGDESEWKSFRLESPDKEHSIYGYVEKGSILEERLRFDADTKKKPVTLSLRYPAGAKTDNQVEIERFVNEGWVEDIDP